jgi:hypothetical protein
MYYFGLRVIFFFKLGKFINYGVDTNLVLCQINYLNWCVVNFYIKFFKIVYIGYVLLQYKKILWVLYYHLLTCCCVSAFYVSSAIFSLDFYILIWGNSETFHWCHSLPRFKAYFATA